jgi:hypothetical protein
MSSRLMPSSSAGSIAIASAMILAVRVEERRDAICEDLPSA